ncbi:MAG: hypothetical protein MJ169_06700 [Treponema sp.]|nr:hypothetical protein [Treponema sp.]
MESNSLTGIERELVLQYLIDGNVPVTVTPVQDTQSGDDEQIKSATSAVFPIALKGEQINVLKEGIILLVNPSESVKSFKNKQVRVEFYFNKLGLYFNTEVKEIKSGLALVIPASINRITDLVVERKLDFSVSVYYSCNDKEDVHIECYPLENYRLFDKPIWADVPEEIAHKTKDYLEEFIVNARKTGTAGTGLQLIPVCRYLAEAKKKMQAVENRREPYDIIFADYERIVFASTRNNMNMNEGCEYALQMNFPVDSPVIKQRKIFATGMVEGVYSDDNNEFVCVVCRYTSLKEEDVRFLFEKTTKKMFL